jgi:hypothetical protein
VQQRSTLDVRNPRFADAQCERQVDRELRDTARMLAGVRVANAQHRVEARRGVRLQLGMRFGDLGAALVELAPHIGDSATRFVGEAGAVHRVRQPLA